MRPRIHPRSSAARVLALVLLVAGWGLPLAFPHLGEDDLLCVVAEGGPGDTPQIGAVDSAAAADHCAVCHLQRTFRSDDLAGHPQPVALESASLRLPVAQQHPLQPARHRLPARAPPV